MLFLLMMQLVEKQRLIEFAEALRSRLNYFDELENVRFGDPNWCLTKIFYCTYEEVRSSQFWFNCFWSSHPCDEYTKLCKQKKYGNVYLSTFFVEVNKPNYVKISTLVLIMAGLWLFRAKHQNFFWNWTTAGETPAVKKHQNWFWLFSVMSI